MKGKPPSRIRAYSHSINCFSLLNRIEGTQWDHSTCRWPSGVMSRPGFHMFLLLAGQALAPGHPQGGEVRVATWRRCRASIAATTAASYVDPLTEHQCIDSCGESWPTLQRVMGFIRLVRASCKYPSVRTHIGQKYPRTWHHSRMSPYSSSLVSRVFSAQEQSERQVAAFCTS